MTLLSTTLNKAFSGISPQQKLCVALSGGMDSAVLLHSVVSQGRYSEVRAFHVNHQLSVKADAWQKYCESLCAGLEVPLETSTINVGEVLQAGGEGLEEAARRLRYQAFAENLREGELLLLAHHADDQYETLLLRLMRGSGVRGLASIPHRRPLGAGELLRPLLALNRVDLEAYAQEAGLGWVEDESNQDTRFDRNYCRHDLLPIFEKRWPQYRAALNKSMQLLGEANQLVDELAQLDLNEAKTGADEVLNLSSLQALTGHRLRNLLRFWLARFGLNETGWKALTTLAHELQSGTGEKTSSKMLLETKHYSLAVFAGSLHLIPPPQPLLENARIWKLSEGNFELSGNGFLSIAQAIEDQSLALDGERIDEFTVRYRRGGEKLKLPGRPTKPLKKLFQESNIAPWLRARIPLLFVGDELVFVPMIGVAESFSVNSLIRPAQSIIWTPAKFNWLNKAKSN